MALKTALSVLGGVVLILVLGGGYAWTSDYGFEATVTEKRATSDGGVIVLTPKVLPTTVEQNLAREAFCMIKVGNFVVYNIQSERVRVYESEGGRIIYDTANGGLQVAPLPQCL
ncbi:MAG TPA: hypothetical protein VM889_13530 [Candidatus Thermoplasmatota archaeon]|nr:hypothetical protein [Candidatus Thermoplasmatota archaeon]